MKPFLLSLKMIIAVALIAAPANVLAQEENKNVIPQITPSSPQSQVFEKYINHQISEYNGLPEITIPLYVIKLKGLEIPISLSYHASGIKWKQYDGEVGAGWSIGASGYRTSRTIHGRPDEDCERYDRTYLEEQIRNIYQNNWPEKKTAYEYFTTLTGTLGTTRDGGQDVFTYYTPTCSGNFIIPNIYYGATNLDKSQSVIRPFLSDNYFTIRDDKGILYSFGNGPNGGNNTEQSVEEGEVNTWRPTTAWGLCAIETPFKETVNFKYQRKFIYPDRNVTGTYTITDAMQPEIGTMDSQSQSALSTNWSTPSLNVLMMTIQEIRTDHEIITFNRIADRTGGIISGSYTNHCIDYILISSTDGSYSKKITFRYKTLPEAESSPQHSHNVLIGIDIADSRAVTVEKYSFEYNEPPGGYTYRNTYPDRWGYYSTGDGGIYYDDKGRYPDVDLEDDNCLYSYNPPGVFTYRKASQYGIPWMDRTPANTSGTHYFSLKKITFPTKGTAEYIYEPNKYRHDDGSLMTGAGQRIAKIISRDHNGDTPPVVTVFKYGENEDGVGIPNISETIDHRCFVREGVLLQIFGNQTFTKLAYAKQRTYMTNPIYPEYNDFHVQYNVITTYQYDEANGNNLGKTRSFYAIRPKYQVHPVATIGPCAYRGTLIVGNYYMGDEPNLIRRETYNGEGKLIDKYILEYDDHIANSSLRQKQFEGVWVQQQLINAAYDYGFDFLTKIGNPFGVSYYYINATWRNLIREQKIRYDDKGENPISVETEYEYDSKNRIKKTTRNLSDGSRLTQDFSYPSGLLHAGLINYNMISTIIASETKHDDSTIEKIINNYPYNSIRMNGITISKGGNLQTDITFDLYDDRGNILQYTTADGVSTSYLWSYTYKYPVAEIKNATYEEVKEVLGYTENSITKSVYPSDNAIFKCWDTIASKLPNALVSVFTYKPLVGVTSVKDPSGRVTYYEYDAFGRLERIKDEDMDTLEEYEYHYKN